MNRDQSKKQGYILRKVIHFAINSILAICALFIPIQWSIPLALIGLFIIVCVEMIRLRTRAKKMVNTAFNPVIKKSEKGKFSGVFWEAFAIALVVPIASPLALSYALALYAIADPGAALIGKYTKSQKLYRNKTVNGTFTFFFSVFIVGIIYLFIFDIGPWFVLCSLLLAIILSLVEVFSDPIDDNFSIIVIGALLINVLI